MFVWIKLKQSGSQRRSNVKSTNDNTEWGEQQSERCVKLRVYWTTETSGGQPRSHWRRRFAPADRQLFVSTMASSSGPTIEWWSSNSFLFPLLSIGRLARDFSRRPLIFPLPTDGGSWWITDQDGHGRSFRYHLRWLVTNDRGVNQRPISKISHKSFSVSDGLRTVELIPERISSVSFTLFRSFFLLEMLQWTHLNDAPSTSTDAAPTVHLRWKKMCQTDYDQLFFSVNIQTDRWSTPNGTSDFLWPQSIVALMKPLFKSDFKSQVGLTFLKFLNFNLFTLNQLRSAYLTK